jgi:tRNA uridine 5-carbamoylmethylation protein Kti12
MILHGSEIIGYEENQILMIYLFNQLNNRILSSDFGVYFDELNYPFSFFYLLVLLYLNMMYSICVFNTLTSLLTSLALREKDYYIEPP